MKKTILAIAASTFITGTILTSCSTPVEKVEDAQQNVNEANKDLNKAQEAYITDIENYRKEIGILEKDEVIGFNTGCSLLFPNKKMTIEQHIELINTFLSFNRFKIMLLGGPEDKDRNNLLAEEFKGKVINTPVNGGVRNGACYESIPQLIITGDSFGMHLAIALKKYVIAWFGLSCWTEIDLYDWGIKLFPEGLFCAPCWKKVCPYNLECVQMIDLEKIVKETINFFDRRKSGKE